MTTETKVKWSIEADFFQTCNCNYGCPCEFEAPPTKGYCDAVDVWRITRGNYGDVRLDGLSFGFIAHWPGPLHLGNATWLYLFDERATPQQREALQKITSAQVGGMPFEILVQVVNKFLAPQFVRFQYQGSGRNTSVKFGDVASIAFEPIKNPVTGGPEDIRVQHGTGFMFKEAEVVSAKESHSSVPGLTWSNSNTAGFIARVKYGN